jgi:hypothetical protein
MDDIINKLAGKGRKHKISVKKKFIEEALTNPEISKRSA